jgi:hypothetical protein
MKLTHLPWYDVELSWGIVNKNWSCGQFLKQEYYQSLFIVITVTSSNPTNFALLRLL